MPYSLEAQGVNPKPEALTTKPQTLNFNVQGESEPSRAPGDWYERGDDTALQDKLRPKIVPSKPALYTSALCTCQSITVLRPDMAANWLHVGRFRRAA